MDKSLRLSPLVKFYDERVVDSRQLATPINSFIGEEFALELMRHYFRSQGYTVSTIDLCTQGTQAGVRLDAWIHLSRGSDEDAIYQTEIKNWSAHSVGGVVIPPGTDDETLKVFRRRNWAIRMDPATNIPREKAARKVLHRMLPPSKLDRLKVGALICFWEAMHPDGDGEPFFSRTVDGESFTELNFFSMSNYVRHLLAKGEHAIPASLRRADAAARWLHDMYA